MDNKTDSLIFKFAIIFLVFTLIVASISGAATFAAQTSSYKAQREEIAQQVADYLEQMLSADGNDFQIFQKYLISNKDSLLVPHDFDTATMQKARMQYEHILAEKHPQKTLGLDITFDELDEEVKNAYGVYSFEYYLWVFEKARDAFDIAYAYYLIPTGEPYHMYWAFDAIREMYFTKGELYIGLCQDVYNKPEENKCMWEAWNTGKVPQGYDEHDNKLGRTVAYYSPLIINGEKLGVIGVGVEIDAINKAIKQNTRIQITAISLILVFCVIMLLIFIYYRYISKLELLQKQIRIYSEVKDPEVATNIEKHITGKDEIAILSAQVSTMILELENYMKNLLSISQELKTVQQRNDAMSELAVKDALTGIRNRTVYDSEIRKLEWKMEDEPQKFGIAIIDLNLLKRINDTYGHEMGNYAIKRLCSIICEIFNHSPVFRTGGDEFTVIIKNSDCDYADSLTEKFNKTIEKLSTDDSLEPWERISAAIGTAVFDTEKDSTVTNVLKRAERLLQTRKKEMKMM